MVSAKSIQLGVGFQSWETAALHNISAVSDIYNLMETKNNCKFFGKHFQLDENA
jgi:hypothetical protein